MRNRTCGKLTGAATALTQHHAAEMVSKWIATEHAMTIEATSGVANPSAHVPGNSRAISFWPSYQQFIGLMCTPQILGAFALKGKPACAHSAQLTLLSSA